MDKVIGWLEAAILSVLAIFAPIHTVLLVTGVLVFGDLITGVIASVKRKEPITSAGLRRSLSKIVIYEAALIFAFLAEQYMAADLPFVKMASGLISVVELKSIMENLNSISGVDLLKQLIDKLGSSNQNKKE